VLQRVEACILGKILYARASEAPEPMRLLRRHPSSSRRGAALLLSVLVLFVVITISIQIGIGTMTDARVARNDLGLAAMDDAIESAMLEVFEQLKNDAEGGESGADQGSDPLGGGMDPTAALSGAGGGEAGGAVDSRQDEWARPQRTEINGLELRLFVQDEDSKYNVLNMLQDDEEMAEECVERVARIIDLAREGTDHDISTSDAESMARDMQEHMLRRYSSEPDEAQFLSTIPNNDRRLPLTLREFARLESFHEGHFRDFRGRDGLIVHSLGSFLTVWSCLTTPSSSSDDSSGVTAGLSDALSGSEASTQGFDETDSSTFTGQTGTTSGDSGGEAVTATGGQDGSDQAADGESASAPGEPSDGFGVNINTAPAAVLKSLFEDRDVSMRFWDDVIEYRNFEEEVELEPGEEEPEPVYDEYGEEVIQHQIFDSIEELQDVHGWEDLSSEEQELVRAYSRTTSNVFSIFITARRSTSNKEEIFIAQSAAEREREEETAAGLVRTVRAVIWRREGGDSGAELHPIVRWEVIDYSPYEVRDYPDEDR